MIASSALESECVAAWNVEVTFMKLPKFRKPENWPNCLGSHALTSQSTARYHTHNERGDSGLSYEPKLWRIHWSGPEESAVSRSIKLGGTTRRLFFGLMALPICLLVPGLGPNLLSWPLSSSLPLPKDAKIGLCWLQLYFDMCWSLSLASWCSGILVSKSSEHKRNLAKAVSFVKGPWSGREIS